MKIRIELVNHIAWSYSRQRLFEAYRDWSFLGSSCGSSEEGAAKVWGGLRGLRVVAGVGHEGLRPPAIPRSDASGASWISCRSARNHCLSASAGFLRCLNSTMKIANTPDNHEGVEISERLRSLPSGKRCRLSYGTVALFSRWLSLIDSEDPQVQRLSQHLQALSGSDIRALSNLEELMEM